MSRWKSYIQGIFSAVTGTKNDEDQIQPILKENDSSVQEKNLVPLIFKDAADVEQILNDPNELERLAELEYEFLPDKIKAVNQVIASKGYGLFKYPTLNDTYALFITELEHKEALTQVDLLGDEDSPDEARYIQYYV